MTEDNPAADERWDPALAQALLGSLVLVGLTYLDRSGEVSRQMQFQGLVVRADPDEGIFLRLEGLHEGEDYSLPPATNAFRPAGPGEYVLRATKERVLNPDFTVSYTIHPPASGGDGGKPQDSK